MSDETSATPFPEFWEQYIKDENLHSVHSASDFPRMRMYLAEQWLAEQPCGWWMDDYRYLRSQRWSWKDALSIVWMSLRRDDRGELQKVEELTNWLGVSRQWFYGRRRKFDNQPAVGLNLWDVLAEQLQLRRLRGSRLAAVDEVTFEKAVGEDTTARDRELYYKRAGVLQNEQRIQLVGGGGGPIEFEDVSDDDLETIRDALSEAGSGGETG